tara:strand:+ start:204 stop:659 length:456 start_codon:yes stop_codon:yes gene_type:complete
MMDSKLIQIAWERFLKKKNLSEVDYLNISRAKSAKQLKKIIGIELGIKKALDEEGVLLSEEEIKKLTEKVLEKTTFEKIYDPRSYLSYEKPSYYNHDVFTMIQKYPWYPVVREYGNWEIYFDDYNTDYVRFSLNSGKTIANIINLEDDGYW